jgi:hypothetical protein
MKSVSLWALLSMANVVAAQKGVTGMYGGFGGELLLRSDSTFEYHHGICMCVDRAWGTWSMSSDTVKFAYDEIQDIYVTVDSLPNRLLDGRSHMVPTYSYHSAPSWDQKTDTIQGDYRDTGCRLSADFRPRRLFAKRDRLYGITGTGKIFKSKVTAVPSAVKTRTHYVKVDRLTFIEGSKQ